MEREEAAAAAAAAVDDEALVRLLQEMVRIRSYSTQARRAGSPA